MLLLKNRLLNDTMDMIQRQTSQANFLLNIRHLVVGMAISLIFILSHPANSQTLDNGGENGIKNPWQISADKIEYDQYRSAYVAEGNVVVSRDGKTLSADEVHLNRQNQEALAIGNVRLVLGKDILSGRRLRLNLESETGEINGGSLFIDQNHLYLSADLIRKTGPQTYTADRITVTACDGPDPDWKLTGQDLKVTIEGYGFAKHTAFWAGNVPLLYSPYLIFPVKLKRQSGLLLPELGYSDRKGVQYLQPLYWAINDNSDATLYAHYMSERGVRTGIEYRYMLSESNMGALFAEGFTDRRIDDGTLSSSEQWGYDVNDGVPRPNDDRYWVRMKHDHDLFWGLTAKLDIDVVSDQDYLHEFKDGYDGFKDTQSYFRNTFKRDIDDEIDPIRTNRLNINRTRHHYTVNTDLRWYDDVIKRRQSVTDDTLHQLPEISVDGMQQPVGNGPFYYDVSGSYINFYSEDDTRGQRIDLSPRIYLPLRLYKSLTVAPSVGAHATGWHLSRDVNAAEPAEKEFYRGLYDIRIDTHAEFFRLFNVSKGKSDQLKHAITPQISYEYIPEKDQTELPEFDDFDRIDSKNLVTYSLTNTLTTRYSQKNSDDQTDFSYHTFLRFKLSQSFDIKKHKDDDPEPFSDITAELDITPKRFVRLGVDAEWSIYDDVLTTFNSDLTLRDNRDDRLTVEYRYSRESIPGADDGLESIDVEAELKINDRWCLRGAYERNIYENKNIESGIGFSYQSQCWGVDFDYTKEEEDARYSIMLNLLGLGSIGNSP